MVIYMVPQYGNLNKLCSLTTTQVIEIPFTRWDLDQYYSADPDAPGKTYAKHGGFIEGAELFDPSCFSLSAAEAATIDPQQRLLLEAAHTAFLAAGWERDRLMGADVGVFVGQCQYEPKLQAATRAAGICRLYP